MTYIKTIEPEEAKGTMKEIYDVLQKNFGAVPHIIRAQSLRPDLAEPLFTYFQRLMLEDHGLSRATKELIAAHVSKVNSCGY
jgi:alkylhydroperoxidase family enzyme